VSCRTEVRGESRVNVARNVAPDAVALAIEKAFGCDGPDGRGVYVNQTGNAILVDRERLLADLSRDEIAPEVLAAIKAAPTCRIPVVWRDKAGLGHVAVLTRHWPARKVTP